MLQIGTETIPSAETELKLTCSLFHGIYFYLYRFVCSSWPIIAMLRTTKTGKLPGCKNMAFSLFFLERVKNQYLTGHINKSTPKLFKLY